MTAPIEKSAEWIYHGVWLVLVECFHVPKHPPSIPSGSTQFVYTFHPSRKYLAYLKCYFWIALVVVDIAILIAWLAVYWWWPLLGWILLIPALVIAIVPDIIAYIAIHLRYDTMWYVMTDRSLRARRGIWTILEHTITFANVQNVYVTQGPIQQLFRIATVVVETAGSSEGESENPFAVGNKAIMQGIGNPAEIQELIMERVRTQRTAGLGDESPQERLATEAWSRQRLALLCEIRDQVRLLR